MSDEFDVAYGGEGKDFVKDLPAIGKHQAVVCQVHSLGYQSFKGQVSASPKCVLIFELDEKMKSGELAGKPFVISQRFSQYMGTAKKHSKLRKFLQDWKGRELTEEEAQKVNIGKLKGAPATIVITHETRDDGNGKRAVIAGISRSEGAPPAVTYTETPEWVTEAKSQAVAAPVKKEAAAQPATAFADSDQLPF